VKDGDGDGDGGDDDRDGDDRDNEEDEEDGENDGLFDIVKGFGSTGNGHQPLFPLGSRCRYKCRAGAADKHNNNNNNNSKQRKNDTKKKKTEKKKKEKIQRKKSTAKDHLALNQDSCPRSLAAVVAGVDINDKNEPLVPEAHQVEQDKEQQHIKLVVKVRDQSEKEEEVAALSIEDEVKQLRQALRQTKLEHMKTIKNIQQQEQELSNCKKTIEFLLSQAKQQGEQGQHGNFSTAAGAEGGGGEEDEAEVSYKGYPKLHNKYQQALDGGLGKYGKVATGKEQASHKHHLTRSFSSAQTATDQIAQQDEDASRDSNEKLMMLEKLFELWACQQQLADVTGTPEKSLRNHHPKSVNTPSHTKKTMETLIESFSSLWKIRSAPTRERIIKGSVRTETQVKF